MTRKAPSRVDLLQALRLEVAVEHPAGLILGLEDREVLGLERDWKAERAVTG